MNKQNKRLKTNNLNCIMKLDDELDDLAPRLREMRQRGDGFQVPPGYFEGLEKDVFRQIDALGARRKVVTAPAAQRTSVWSWFWQPRLGLALGLLLALVAVIWWWRPPGEQPADLAQTEISAEDAEAYLLDNLSEADPDLLASCLSLEESADMEAAGQPAAGPSPTPVPDADISPEEIQHLLDDMTDEELEELL